MFIDDPAGVLGAQAAEIQATASPFDVKVVVTSTDSRAALDARVGQMTNSANTLAIGIDPVHHYTFTHFGVGTGVPRDRYQDVARAGNGEFKAGHWGEGVKAIVASATGARQEARPAHATTIVMPSQVNRVETPFPWVGLGVGALALAAGFLLLWWWSKRRAAAMEATLGEFRDEAAQLRSRNIAEQGWHDRMAATVGDAAPASPARAKTYEPTSPPARPAYRPPSPVVAPSPAPVVIQGGSNDGLLTGIVLGEAFSRDRYEPPVYRERYSPPPRERTPEPSRSFDSGSSSSPWGSDSSSSSDSGSGGGDFGGGFDGGGGGGDF